MPGDDPAVQAGVAAGQQAAAAGKASIQKTTQAGVGVDSGQALGIYAPGNAPFLASSGSALVVNKVYVCRFVAPRNVLVRRMIFGVSAAATADDQCDVGIFSGDGTKLICSSGVVNGKLNAGGAKTCNMQTPGQLYGGQVYYSAFGVGTNGGTAAQIGVALCAGSAAFLLQLFGGAIGSIEFGNGNVTIPLTAPLPPIAGIGSTPIFALQET